jgi:hypothetical protein
MFYDAETIQQAMARAGRLAQGDIAATLNAFDQLALSRQERLAAIASAIAATLKKRHAGDGEAFLKALRDLTRPAIGHFGDPDEGELFLTRVVEGLRVIDKGLDRLIERLEAAGLPSETAAVVETVMLARLLAAHRPLLITLALEAAELAADRDDFRPGDIVPLVAVRQASPTTGLAAAG